MQLFNQQCIQYVLYMWKLVILYFAHVITYQTDKMQKDFIEIGLPFLHQGS